MRSCCTVLIINKSALFRELIKVNGVGPKLALAILSGMSAQQFVTAIEREEVSTLVKLPGVGKKTAERLVVEMKDRFKGLTGDLFNNHSDLPVPAAKNLPAKLMLKGRRCPR